MKQRKIHFVGIKGVGMTSLAILAKEAGFEVTGCDIGESFITDDVLEKAGIKPNVNFSQSHLDGVDLVITTGAHGGSENPEVKAAKLRGIEALSHGQALGLFMKGSIFGRSDIEGISVAGTHGKTTTTAMLASIFMNAQTDPSYIIGTSTISSLKSPGHFGKGKYFIAEADEYATDPVSNVKARFLWQYPKTILLTNIELDHPDIYMTVEQVKNVFSEFVSHLPSEGMLIMNGDDKNCLDVARNFRGTIFSYGFSKDCDYKITHVSVKPSETSFSVEAYGTNMGNFTMQVMGEHNALNALGAAVVALQSGVSFHVIQKSLSQFQGTKRRSEYIGRLKSGAYIYDDYAHHPTEIKKTLHAFRTAFPPNKIIVIFQPHTYSRTKKLFEDFISSFSDASEVGIMNIYSSQREADDPTISGKLVAERISKIHPKVYFLPEKEDVVQYLTSRNLDNRTIIITMGAGDIYKISQEVVE